MTPPTRRRMVRRIVGPFPAYCGRPMVLPRAKRLNTYGSETSTNQIRWVVNPSQIRIEISTGQTQTTHSSRIHLGLAVVGRRVGMGRRGASKFKVQAEACNSAHARPSGLAGTPAPAARPPPASNYARAHRRPCRSNTRQGVVTRLHRLRRSPGQFSQRHALGSAGFPTPAVNSGGHWFETDQGQRTWTNDQRTVCVANGRRAGIAAKASRSIWKPPSSHVR
jgi:hypothetical protein